MKALGLFGLTIPEEYGGLGLTMEEEIWFLSPWKNLPAFRSIMGTNNGIGSAAVVFNGQKNKSRSTCRNTPPANGSPAFASRNRKPVLMPPH